MFKLCVKKETRKKENLEDAKKRESRGEVLNTSMILNVFKIVKMTRSLHSGTDFEKLTGVRFVTVYLKLAVCFRRIYSKYCHILGDIKIFKFYTEFSNKTRHTVANSIPDEDTAQNKIKVSVLLKAGASGNTKKLL